MEHIISPWFIYWLGIVDNLGALLCIILVFSLIATIVATIACFVGTIEGEDTVAKVTKKILKISIPILIVSSILSVITPSKTTLIQMVVADKLTYDVAEKAFKSGSGLKNELKQDVIDIINVIGEANNGLIK